MIKEDGQVGKKKTEKGEEPRRKRGRPSKSKYDEEIHIPATPDELAICIRPVYFFQPVQAQPRTDHNVGLETSQRRI